MRTTRVLALGGCHVAGYLVGADHAFPHLFGQLLGNVPDEAVPHVQFARLPEHLVRVAEQKPSHVLLQLGNYECSDSFRGLLRQFDSATLAKLAKPARPASPSPSAAGPGRRWRQRLRTLTLAAAQLPLWALSRRYHRGFAALNRCIAQHPDTVFLCLTPFPSLNPTVNLLRRLGGRLLRRQLAPQPNLRWLDSHQLLPPAAPLFADELHLSRAAHQVVAYALLAAAVQQAALVGVEALAGAQVAG